MKNLFLHPCWKDHLLRKFEAFLRPQDVSMLNEYEMSCYRIQRPDKLILKKIRKTTIFFKMDDL